MERYASALWGQNALESAPPFLLALVAAVGLAATLTLVVGTFVKMVRMTTR